MFRFIWRSLPLYGVFFLWGFGTGAQQLARPLFAASFGVSVFLVSLIQASNSLAWLVAAPTTGYLTDRFGRKPLTIAGNMLRGVTMVFQYYATNYVQFFVLEFIGGIGVATWLTGSSIIMADITRTENRGRAMAIRTLAMKVGLIAGLFVGGYIARFWGLRFIFLFGAVTKIPIHLLLAWMVKETRPGDAPAKPAEAEATAEPEAEPAAQAAPVAEEPAAPPPPPEEKLGVRYFLRIPVLVLAFAVFTISTVGAPQGVFGSLFPLYSTRELGLSPADVGQLLSLAGIAGVLISFPNGMLADRFGRKVSMVPGLLLLAVASVSLAGANAYIGLLVAVLIYGLGDGMSLSTSEVTAMDLAPERGRGTFLGIWSVFRNVGGIAAPILVGTTAQNFGLNISFVAIGGLAVVSAVIMGLFGLETHQRLEKRSSEDK